MDWRTLTLLHLVPTGWMAGLIWFVQVVHYPLYARVGAREFRDYEQRHCARVSFVVLPPMVAELGLAGWLVAVAPERAVPWATAGLVLALGIWASTFLLQVPCHDRLQAGFDAATHRRLVATNWLRTACWSARLVVALQLAATAV